MCLTCSPNVRDIAEGVAGRTEFIFIRRHRLRRVAALFVQRDPTSCKYMSGYGIRDRSSEEHGQKKRQH
jgi:hypothetical protein